MDRRSFLRCASFAPLAGAAILASGSAKGSAPVGFERVSTERGDPGYRAWCHIHGDGKSVRVYLDGVEQPDCLMADASIGEVKRIERTAAGNLAHDGESLLYETVKGFVEIKIE